MRIRAAFVIAFVLASACWPIIFSEPFGREAFRDAGPIDAAPTAE